MPSTKHDYCAHPECLRKEDKQLIKGRGLCRACYNKAQRQGWLHTWTPPVRRPEPVVVDTPPSAHGEQDGCEPPIDLRPLLSSTQSLEETAQADTAEPRPDAWANPNPTQGRRTSTSVERIVKQPRKLNKALAKDFKVSVDFAPAAHVLEEIKVRAEREMRPVALQILWELKQAMSGEVAA